MSSLYVLFLGDFNYIFFKTILIFSVKNEELV